MWQDYHSQTFSLPKCSSREPIKSSICYTPAVLPNPVGAPTGIAAMGDDIMVADLTKHMKQAFEEISLSANYPMPMFYCKKGENPEDHYMKAEDYFKVYKIEKDEDKRKRFTDTLFLTARRWAEYLFLQRFTLKG